MKPRSPRHLVLSILVFNLASACATGQKPQTRATRVTSTALSDEAAVSDAMAPSSDDASADSGDRETSDIIIDVDPEFAEPSENGESTAMSVLTDKFPDDALIKQTQRKHHYDADLKLAPKEATKMSGLISLIKSRGGIVQDMGGLRVTADIPSDKMLGLIDEISKKYQVTSRKLQIEDFTDRFYDLATRKQILTALVAKYEALFKTASTGNQITIQAKLDELRAALIDITTQYDNVKRRVAMSQLTIRIEETASSVARTSYFDSYFTWLNQIDERIIPTTDGSMKSIPFQTPAGFATVVRTDKITQVANPHNILITAYSRKNQPQGSSSFWQSKAKMLWGERSTKVTPKTIGSFRVIRVEVPQSNESGVLVAGFWAKGDRVHVIQGIFPNQVDYKENIGKLELAMRQAGGRK